MTTETTRTDTHDTHDTHDITPADLGTVPEATPEPRTPAPSECLAALLDWASSVGLDLDLFTINVNDRKVELQTSRWALAERGDDRKAATLRAIKRHIGPLEPKGDPPNVWMEARGSVDLGLPNGPVRVRVPIYGAYTCEKTGTATVKVTLPASAAVPAQPAQPERTVMEERPTYRCELKL